MEWIYLINISNQMNRLLFYVNDRECTLSCVTCENPEEMMEKSFWKWPSFKWKEHCFKALDRKIILSWVLAIFSNKWWNEIFCMCEYDSSVFNWRSFLCRFAFSFLLKKSNDLICFKALLTSLLIVKCMLLAVKKTG